jgi:hypothetical protein
MFRRIKRESQDQVSVSQEWRIAQLRSLNDFILDNTWDVPNHSDADRLINRIINNLLYYQTNYFVLSIVITFLVG